MVTDRPELTPALIAAAREIANKIAAQLDADMTAQTVALTREEAVLAQGLLEGVAAVMDKEAGRLPSVRRQRANAAHGAGYEPKSGDAILLVEMADGSLGEWAFPADDITRVMLSLSNAHAAHIRLSGPATNEMLVVDSVQLRPGPQGHLVLDATLSAGFQVNMILAKSQASQLRDDLIGALG